MQIKAMQSRYPALSVTRSTGELVFRGELQAWNGGSGYEVKVTVPDRGGPKVRVIQPKVRKDAPHLYDDNGLLCLYHPARRPWKTTDLAALTVMPWAELWLYFYEEWLQTGIWWGEEAKHDAP